MKKAFLVSSLEHTVRAKLSEYLPPAHFVKVYSRMRTWFLDMLASCRPEAYVPVDKVNVRGLTFRNCLGNAAGFDKDGKLLPFNYLMGAGFAVVGTVLSEPWHGNLFQTYDKKSNPWTPLPYSNSAINSLGLPNHGMQYVKKNIAKFRNNLRPVDFPIIASVMGHPNHKDEHQKLVGIVLSVQELIPLVDGFEINESCPNTQHSDSGLELRLKTVLGVRDSHYASFGRYVPVWVKMRDAGNPDHTVDFLTKMGIDGIVLTNTQINYPEIRRSVHQKDLQLFDYYTEVHKGGVSGPLIKTFAYQQVAGAASAIERQKSRLVVTHVGGIGSWSDITHSKNLNPNIVKLHEWYTGFMYALGAEDPSAIYKNMISGKK
jgi:dihydroorotate dehydrogenase